MPKRRGPPARSRGDQGFALIIVLWMLVLVSFFAALIATSGRTELRISGNLIANGETAAAADGAVYHAVFALIDPQPELRWRLDGSTHRLAIGDSVVDVTLLDEAGRINPNLASPALLEALLRSIGRDPESARQLAQSIKEWIGYSASPRPKAVVLAEYQQSGRDYAPPGAPMLSLDELDRIVGMTPTMVSALRPHLSLFAPALPNAAHADPVVAAALALIDRDAAPASVLPSQVSDNQVARIQAIARGPSNAVVTRTAIVEVGPAQLGGYAVVAWDAAAD